MAWKASNRRLLRMLLVAIGLVAWALSHPPPEVQAQEKVATWNRWDVDITIQDDGTFDVVETHEVEFSSGRFTGGYRNIPLGTVQLITNIMVSEGDTRYREDTSEVMNTFYTKSNHGELTITWFFSPTFSASRTFTISYTVHGGLMFYNDSDQLWWKAVGPDRDAPVRSSTITVRLPEGAQTELAGTDGSPADIPKIARDKQSVIFTSKGQILPGNAFEVRVQWPHGYVSTSPTTDKNSWKRPTAVRAVTGNPALVTLLSGIISLVIFSGGLLAANKLLRHPRQRYDFGSVPSILSQPPGDLEPGMAGALVDGKVKTKHIVATLIDLAHRQFINIEETAAGEFILRRLSAEEKQLNSYELAVFRKIFPVMWSVKLSDLKNEFSRKISPILNSLRGELVKAELFASTHRKDRYFYAILCGAILLISASIAVGFWVESFPIAQTNLTSVMPCMAGSLLAIASLIIRYRGDPPLTPYGVEQQAKWRAFKKYLKQIQQFTDLEEAAELFEKYLPYAIAFGIEKSWIKKFARVPQTPQPNWYITPVMTTFRQYSASASGISPGPSVSLDGMADGIFAGLSDMSDGLFSFLNTSAHTFSSAPTARSAPASGAGIAGGGGFTGGGFSGGGGGFSGGGGGGGFF